LRAAGPPVDHVAARARALTARTERTNGTAAARDVADLVLGRRLRGLDVAQRTAQPFLHRDGRAVLPADLVRRAGLARPARHRVDEVVDGHRCTAVRSELRRQELRGDGAGELLAFADERVAARGDRLDEQTD